MLLDTDSKSQFSTTDTDNDPPTTNNLDDIFASDSDSDSPNNPLQARHSRNSNLGEVSDQPRLRAIHNTNGYRDGIALAKEKYIQDGFDEGYMLGAELGARCGWCLGVLEGIATAAGAGKEVETQEPEVRKLLKEASVDLGMKKVYGEEFFGLDGVWRFDVPGGGSEGEGEGNVTFRQVADAHPLLKKWIGVVRELAQRMELDLEVLGREEGERDADGE
jgi:hypothetical protein